LETVPVTCNRAKTLSSSSTDNFVGVVLRVTFRACCRAGAQALEAAVCVLYKRSKTEPVRAVGKRVSRRRWAVALGVRAVLALGVMRRTRGSFDDGVVVVRLGLEFVVCGVTVTPGVVGGFTPTGAVVVVASGKTSASSESNNDGSSGCCGDAAAVSAGGIDSGNCGMDIILAQNMYICIPILRFY
jgi:hypothetical protein